MTLEEIKAAVLAGKKVCQHNSAYEVQHHSGEFLIVCTLNQHTIGLTWLDGVTLNGKPKDFFIRGSVGHVQGDPLDKCQHHYDNYRASRKLQGGTGRGASWFSCQQDTTDCTRTT